MGKQKVAIFAARSTIGKEVARLLSSGDNELALLGRDLSNVDTTSATFTQSVDLTDFDAVDDAVAAAAEELQGLTGIVNCAGSILLKPAHLTSRNSFDETIESNLTTAFAAVRASAKYLEKGNGSCVLISSAAARLGMPNHELIASVKAGVEGLARSAASTYASRGLRFNCVAPGLVDTAMSSHLITNPESRKISESLHPIGRIGSPRDIASAICWLLDPEQSWVTGQTIGVDGGLANVQPRPKFGKVSS